MGLCEWVCVSFRGIFPLVSSLWYLPFWVRCLVYSPLVWLMCFPTTGPLFLPPTPISSLPIYMFYVECGMTWKLDWWSPLTSPFDKCLFLEQCVVQFLVSIIDFVIRWLVSYIVTKVDLGQKPNRLVLGRYTFLQRPYSSLTKAGLTHSCTLSLGLPTWA